MIGGLIRRLAGSGLRPEPRHWVRGEAFDPGWDEADSAYQAVHAATDGRVYFTLCTHRLDANARVGCFDPGTDRILFVRDVGEALRHEPVHAVPQGKLHAPPGEAAGRLVLATVHGYYAPDLAGRAPYPGFHILQLDMRSGELQDLVRGPAEEEGLITGALDPIRLVYHGLTYPSGKLCRYDLGSGELAMGPPPCRERATASRIRGRSVYPVCRSLAIDADGSVYGACRDGSVWRRAPGAIPAVLPGVSVLDGAVAPLDATGREDGLWRVLVRSERERCFYGIHSGSQSLFRFDPERRRIEPLSRIGIAALHTKGHAPFRSQMGLAFGPGERVLYHVAHGPRRTAWLISYDLSRGAFREHGPLCTEAGERVLFAESLACGAEGSLYTVAWVDVVDPSRRARHRRLRRVAANGECAGEVYRMMLLRLRPAEIERSGG